MYSENTEPNYEMDLETSESELNELETPGSVSSEKTAWPLPGNYEIRSSYGERINPVTHNKEMHKGTDIKAEPCTTAVSIMDGTVSEVKYHHTTGYHIVISHTGGIESHYIHICKPLTKKSAAIMKGQPVGCIARTGLSTGSHLHIEIKENGRWVDPEKYIKCITSSTVKVPAKSSSSVTVASSPANKASGLDDISMKNFRFVLPITKRHEGMHIFVNHKADRGGATMNGVTQKTYDAYRQSKGLPVQNVMYISDKETDEIYYRLFFAPVVRKGNIICPAISLVLFEIAVMSGPARALKILQKTLKVNETGKWNQETSVEYQKQTGTLGSKSVALNMINLYKDYLKSIGTGTQSVFLKGWLKRWDDNLKQVSQL